MSLSVAFFETNERKFSLRPRRARVFARTVHSTGGQAIPFDSITSINGIPLGIEGGRKADEKEGRVRLRGRIMVKNFIFSHYICILYASFMCFIGAIWQGWF